MRYGSTVDKSCWLLGSCEGGTRHGMHKQPYQMCKEKEIKKGGETATPFRSRLRWISHWLNQTQFPVTYIYTLYITYLKWPSTHKNSFFFFFFYKLRIICAKTGSALPHILKKRLIVDYTSHGCSFQQTTCSLKSLRHGKTPMAVAWAFLILFVLYVDEYLHTSCVYVQLSSLSPHDLLAAEE